MIKWQTTSTSDVAMGSKFGLTTAYLKGFGSMDSPQELVFSGRQSQMKNFSKATGSKTGRRTSAFLG